MEQTIQNSPDTDNVTVQSVDEKITSFFHFDALLSAQYFDTLRRKTLLEPEKRLMLAVLDDAIHCYRDNLFSRRGKNKQLFDAAKEWITAPGDNWIFCFDNVCESLGFNPEYVRRGLLQWKGNNPQKRSSSATWDEKRLAG
jgi:hypothetical protein